MVRNTTGGTKTKGLARKHQSSGGSSAHVRVPQCEEEQFAYVSKMLGNGMCEVYIGEKSTRLIGHIRNKFRGRQKRHNQIVSNSIVLVGLRDWESTLKNCDILCIYEDNEINQLVALGFLEEFGQTADVAKDGTEAVAMALKKNYDLVLMDIHMPGMDGVEAARRIGEMPGRSPFFVAMTADAMVGDREHYLEMGMDHYISKPIDVVDLKSVLNMMSNGNPKDEFGE